MRLNSHRPEVNWRPLTPEQREQRAKEIAGTAVTHGVAHEAVKETIQLGKDAVQEMRGQTPVERDTSGVEQMKGAAKSSLFIASTQITKDVMDTAFNTENTGDYAPKDSNNQNS